MDEKLNFPSIYFFSSTFGNGYNRRAVRMEKKQPSLFHSSLKVTSTAKQHLDFWLSLSWRGRIGRRGFCCRGLPHGYNLFVIHTFITGGGGGGLFQGVTQEFLLIYIGMLTTKAMKFLLILINNNICILLVAQLLYNQVCYFCATYRHNCPWHTINNL